MIWRPAPCEVDGVRALVEAIPVAFVGAGAPSRLRALDEDDPRSRTATGLRGSSGGDEAGEAAADDDDVCVRVHAHLTNVGGRL